MYILVLIAIAFISELMLQAFMSHFGITLAIHSVFCVVITTIVIVIINTMITKLSYCYC